MKLATLDSKIISNVPQKGSFKITASPKAFKILSSSLYSAKELAVVRELSTNAFDAHAAVGKQNIPFEIHLPSISEPWFSVEDFGCGMDEELINEVYTTYFGSTKAETNDEAGFMGLGSKSPFSYTDSFTVQTIRDGVKLVYTMALSATGEPAPHLMLKQNTDQQNGTKVKVPVDKYDIGKFIEAARRTFRSFSVKPIVYGTDDSTAHSIVKEQEYLFKNDVYGIRIPSKSSNGDSQWPYPSHIFAIQGPVAYPIDQIHTKLGRHDVCKTTCIDAFFPIGELDPTASRESLSFDPNTSENIKRRFEEINSRIVSDIHEYISAAPNLFDAHVRAHIVKTLDIIDIKKMRPTYNGIALINWGSHYEFDSHHMTQGFSFFASRLKSTRRTRTIRVENVQLTTHSLPIDLSQPYFFNDIGRTKGSALFKKYVKENSIKESMFITFAPGYDISSNNVKEFMHWLMDQIPGLSLIPLSSIPVAKAPKIAKVKTGIPSVKTWKYVTTEILKKRGKLVPQEILETNAAVIARNFPRLYVHASQMNNNSTHALLKIVSNECERSGLPHFVYVLTKPDYNLAMKGSVAWIHAFDFLKSMINKKTIDNIQQYNSIRANNETLECIVCDESRRKKSLILEKLNINGESQNKHLSDFEIEVLTNRFSVKEVDLSIYDALFEKSKEIPVIDISVYHDFCSTAKLKYPMLKFVNISSQIGTANELDIIQYMELIDSQEEITND